ncbi:MAG: Maf family protein [Candidatus Melainabacteria bacterium]|nr:MAG: Maf family protein [Candidatus Melainabacteria bacterium]
MNTKKIILASNSPRRKEILKSLNINFEIIPSNYDEPINENDIFSYQKIENIALNKAKSILNQIKTSSLIISADTVVVNDNKVLLKPKNQQNAFNILKSLSNKKHKVVTSVCLYETENNNYITYSSTTKVYFNELSDKQINNYILTFKPYDKAGAYGIQELPDGFLNKIEGSFSNVVGLSKEDLAVNLTKLNINIPN